jgi:hypothetical protein
MLDHPDRAPTSEVDLVPIRVRDASDREWLSGRVWHSPTIIAAIEDRAALLREVDHLRSMLASTTVGGKERA